MVGIKKNWLYNQENTAIKMEYILIIYGIIVLLTKIFIDSRIVRILVSVYSGAFLMIMFMVFLYPLTILIGMLPYIDTIKPYMNIGNLPLSKKKLFMMSLKSNGLKMLALVGVSFIINMFLQSSIHLGTCVEGSLNYQLSRAVDTLLVALIIFFQAFVISIFYYVKGFSGKKASLIVFGIDAVVLIILLGIGAVIGNDFIGSVEFLFIAGGTFFVGSFIGFLKYWNDIERVCN
ncbi:hypothetical protein [uncultured Clostridium sp.]|uniref:hypothetical protein n=1 Tax=uncultured Clostridium sp. TaxID=59620 RepID=UPI00260E2E56|nr:hypothetical protein [uncultured Clostridium sp.]